MFCCCPQDTEISTSESIKKTSSVEDNIQTGKGTVSSHTNHTTTKDLKKNTVHKQETLPIVKQPINETRDLSNTKPPSEVFDPALVNICIDEKVGSSAKSFIESNSTADTALTASSMLEPAKLNIISSEIDKIDKAISESKAKSDWELKNNIVPDLANQLKVLTSQVTEQLKGMAEKDLQAVVSRLEAVATKLESLAFRSSASSLENSATPDALSPFVLAYDEIISGPLAKYLSLSNLVGGDVKNQANLVKLAFEAQRNFLVVVSKSKTPDQNVFIELLRPSADKLQTVQDFRENNRKSEYFNHLSAISESIASLGWVTVSPAPGPYVKEMLDAGTFYTNRVLKDFKEKDQNHVEWSRSWIATLTELQGYIKQYHTTGLSWNPKGGDAKSISTSSATSAPPPPTSSSAPPPPPPPGPPPPAISSSKDDEGAAAKAALFAQLNKGEDVTKGLKKVTDDMKTHKNPTLRHGPAPFKPTPGAKPQTSPKPGAKSLVVPTKPPLIELQDKKWIIEYQKDNKNIILDNTEIKQTVYIYKCEGSVIQVKGKVNSIILDSCKKTAVVFDDLVSSVEFVNCQSMQAQVTGKVPTLSIDKTDGCLVYLSPLSLDVEIVTAKSSEMNILVPQGDGDYKEFALPEQFKSKYDGKTLVTAVADSV